MSGDGVGLDEKGGWGLPNLVVDYHSFLLKYFVVSRT